CLRLVARRREWGCEFKLHSRRFGIVKWMLSKDLLILCLKFVFEIENSQLWVLTKHFLNCIAALQREKSKVRVP
ncbi:MAG TPA: hypothetical protein PKE17_19600, partial [Saprospiraceae bacterium]|nr:hypothetical protein [Saprospiraceae bacterium]